MSNESPRGNALDHQAGTRRIFLIHLRLDAMPAEGRLCGRVQHQLTGDAAHFESVVELVEFLAEHVTPWRE